MIPKKIHYCWLGGKPLPESAKKCIRSWKKYCPGYEIIEWNETNYDFTKQPYMRQALEAKKWGFVPDYARLDIVYQHGGIYLDTDVEMIKPFDDLLQYAGFAGFENERNVALGLGFGAEAGNHIIKVLMDSYESMDFINKDGNMNLIAAPQTNSEVLESLGVIRNNTYQKIDGFVFFPTEYFCPKSFNDGFITITDHTYSIHHYDASWFSKEQQKKKKERWKSKKRKRRIKKMRAFVKRVGIKVFGEQLYKKIRRVEK